MPRHLSSISGPYVLLSFIAHLFHCSADAVTVSIRGAPEGLSTLNRRLHAKNKDLGEVPLYIFRQILIEGDDAQLCKDGEEVISPLTRTLGFV